MKINTCMVKNRPHDVKDAQLEQVVIDNLPAQKEGKAPIGTVRAYNRKTNLCRFCGKPLFFS